MQSIRRKGCGCQVTEREVPGPARLRQKHTKSCPGKDDSIKGETQGTPDYRVTHKSRSTKPTATDSVI